MRLLRPKTGVGDELPRPIHRRSGAEVREALIAPCDASDRLCSKRLKPIIPVPLTALERHGVCRRKSGWPLAAGADVAAASVQR
jgi:hypothetical protein